MGEDCRAQKISKRVERVLAYPFIMGFFSFLVFFLLSAEPYDGCIVFAARTEP